MVSGIEAAGIALALIPLLINQIDNYARGIERLKLLSNYHRELLTYTTGLSTQHAIFQCTLESVLENVVDDQEAVAGLIGDPRGAGWKDPTLQKALLRKLGRNYGPFFGNVNSLSELLERLTGKLNLPNAETDQTCNNVRSFWKFWKIVSRAVYDDLLEKIEATNTILRTLIDQANEQEERRERQKPWTRLLRQYQGDWKHIESLFQTIAGGSSWKCRCRAYHCVHVRLQPYLAEHNDDPCCTEAQSSFYFMFSNIHATSQTGAWNWREAMFKPHVNGSRQNSTNLTTSSKKLISDLCSSLQSFDPMLHQGHHQKHGIGYISEDVNSVYQYTMHAVQGSESSSLEQSLREALASLSRRNRLYIAASLACAVLRYHENWLKNAWDSSNFHLTAKTSDSVYLSWPLSTPRDLDEQYPKSSEEKRESILQSLGVSLVELSLGRPLDPLISAKNETRDCDQVIDNSTLNLTKQVRQESGWHYANVVDNCFSWSGVSTICRESHSFEERLIELSLLC
ncbi:unnamed protein product [Penicillium salamii]|nr:unnamed protein product [Penicillium salamii]CAG8407265.1 unnamed protein product [Penicillium salamii]